MLDLSHVGTSMYKTMCSCSVLKVKMYWVNYTG